MARKPKADNPKQPETPKEPKTGPFGPIYKGFKDKGTEAIKHLMEVQQGECPEALYNPIIGHIDLVWGEWTGKNEGSYGLKKIIAKHGKEFEEAGFDLAETLPKMLRSGILKVKHLKDRAYLENEAIKVVIKYAIENNTKKFVLTSFVLSDFLLKKKGKVLGPTSVNPLTTAPTSQPAPSDSVHKTKNNSMKNQNKKPLGYLAGLKAKFSAVTEIPRSQIALAPKMFQNREGHYSSETVDKILREGFDKSQEPIAVWRDPVSGKYLVISGHSRWHASEILFEKGDKSLAKMPVKIFNGDLEAAKDYALLESNRSGTEEGLKSDLKAYKRAKEKGKSHAELLSLFKTDSKIKKLENLSYLNPKGKFLEFMGSDSEKSFKYLERNSGWVGILRKVHPALTDFHENEMFDYMYGGSKKEVEKDDFFNLVEKKVTASYFKPSEPLNLKNRVSTSAYTSQGQEALNEINSAIDKLQTERNTKEENIARAKKEVSNEGKREAYIKKWKEELSLINQAILRKLEEKTKIENGIKKLERQTEFDLFNAAPEPIVTAAPVKEAKKEVVKPEEIVNRVFSGQEELNEINSAINQLQSARNTKEENIARLKKFFHSIGVEDKNLKRWEEELSLINQAILNNIELKTKIENGIEPEQKAAPLKEVKKTKSSRHPEPKATPVKEALKPAEIAQTKEKSKVLEDRIKNVKNEIKKLVGEWENYSHIVNHETDPKKLWKAQDMEIQIEKRVEAKDRELKRLENNLNATKKTIAATKPARHPKPKKPNAYLPLLLLSGKVYKQLKAL